MGNFVLTLVLAAIGTPDYAGPPTLVAPGPTYHASMTACVQAGRRGVRDFSGPRMFVRYSCAYRGDRATSANPFGSYSAEEYGW